MKQWRLPLLLVTVLLVSWMAAYWDEEQSKKDAHEEKREKAVLSEFEWQKIKGFRLEKPNSKALEGKVQGAARHWFITQGATTAKADQGAIQAMGEALENLSAIKRLSVQQDELEGFGLKDPRLVLTLRGPSEDQVLKVGANAPTGYSTYLQLGGESEVLVVSQSVGLIFFKDFNELRSKALMWSPSAEIKEFRYKNQTGAITVARDGEGKLAIKEAPFSRLDEDELIDYLSWLGSVRVKGFVSAPPKGEELMELSWRDGEDLHYSLKFFQAGEELFAQRDMGGLKSVVALAKDVRSSLEKKLAQFRYSLVVPLNAQRIQKLEINGITYERKGQGEASEWESSAQGLDPQYVQDFLIDLEFLKAKAFVPKKEMMADIGEPLYRVTIDAMTEPLLFYRHNQTFYVSSPEHHPEELLVLAEDPFAAFHPVADSQGEPDRTEL